MKDTPTKTEFEAMAIRINLKEPMTQGLEADLISHIDSHLSRVDLSTEERNALGRIRQRIVIEFII